MNQRETMIPVLDDPCQGARNSIRTEKVAPILKALSEEGVLAMKAGP